MKGSKIYYFGIMIILSCRQVKPANARRGFLRTSLICLKINSPKAPKGTRLYKSPPQEFYQPGETDSCQEETRDHHHTQTNFFINYDISLISSSKGPFIFPKNYFPSSLFPIK